MEGTEGQTQKDRVPGSTGKSQEDWSKADGSLPTLVEKASGSGVGGPKARTPSRLPHPSWPSVLLQAPPALPPRERWV